MDELNSLKNIAKSIYLDYQAVMAGQSNLNEELDEVLEFDTKGLAYNLRKIWRGERHAILGPMVLRNYLNHKYG